ncbi:SufE family protein [Alcanivorax quisquiliarum]|uniref:SufE family protein n=1 Tax=Alcanivorax quisquiliarum TaxID=2933565 RepID=A0ABT0E7F6_9GAMM|nr:SufE family protein [Alcanivorax quisquiliarum]MCK0537773.1 SufE family protein [Alcanivorax quisquiliarum]
MTTLDLDNIELGRTITADDVVDALSFFDDWEQRYEYIIDLGRQLPAFPEEMKDDARIVRGCQSQVWLETGFDDASGELRLAVDSDALIVRGLAAIVLAALNRKPPQAVVAYDMEGYFDSIDLLKHLSPTRGNGVRAMVKRIQDEARRRASAA